MQKDCIAFDKATVRTKDDDGRLHIAITNISKANVCGYLGSEIPDADILGLKPDTIYQLLRDPEELKKAAKTFNNLPVLSEHVAVTARDHRPDLVIGSTGTDAEFVAPYLRNSAVIWVDSAIERIESGLQKEISSAYRYKADMTPGEYEGVKYDGVMRDIIGQHVAIVPDGRAGPDVVVGDTALNKNQRMEITMPERLSRKAAYARGALAIAIKPKLATDAKPATLHTALNAALIGVTSKNWKDSKPRIVNALKAGLAGKLAKDANLDDVCKMAMDSLDDEGKAEDKDMGVDDDMPDDTDVGEDEDKIEKVMGMLKGMLNKEQMEKIREACMPKAAEDEPPPFEGEPKTEAEKKARDKAAKDKAAKDKAAKDKAAKDKAAKDAEEEESRRKEAEDEEEDDDKKKVTKSAMDAAIAAAVRNATEQTMRKMNEIADAKSAVEPLVGKLTVAMDSAEQVYQKALTGLGIDVTGVNLAGLKLLAAQRMEMQNAPRVPRLKIAADASDKVTEFRKSIGDDRNIRRLG